MMAPLRDFVRSVGLTACVLGSVLAFADTDPFARPLTDAEIEKMLPLLKAEAQDLAASRDELKALLEASVANDEKNGELLRSIVAGKVDPLEWLKKSSRSAIAPSGALYNVACSRSWSRHLKRPAAVFDLGPDAREAKNAVASARAFYKAKGFRASGKIEPYNWGFHPNDDSLSASVMELNHFFRHDECNGMGPGPTVVLAASPEKLERPLTGVPVEISQGRSLADQLKFNRVSEAQYQLFRLRVVMAREDAKNLSALSLEAPGSAESPAAARVRRKLEVEMGPRKASAEAYQRHEPELEKWLD